jgi:hypothetical protein
MNKYNALILALGSLALVSCGGGGESAKKSAEKGKIVSAEKAKNADQAVEVYAVHLNRIADSIEAIESEADAEKAAKVIAEATKEFDVLAEKFKGANEMQMAAAFAKQASQFSQPQMRIGLAMQRLATENPEYLEKISDALRDMPPVQ